ncbi:MAG: hypothetical protein ACJ8CR_26795 [Roseiflexaceae bacterium]
MPYVTIFDAVQRTQTWLYVFPISITIVALILFWIIRLGVKQTLLLRDIESVHRVLPFVVVLMFTAVVLLFSATDAADYYTALWAFREHRYHLVEGRVSQFSLIPEGGHGAGHFRINTTEFFYYDSRLDYFLKQPYPAMDHFQDRTWARVSYYTDRFGDKKIIKVEVRSTRVQTQ